MKKIFTLLFCLAAMTISASAQDESLVDQCVNIVLGNENATMTKFNFDVNNDGVIDIADVTLLIDVQRNLAANRAPAQDGDIDALIQEVLTTTSPEPNLTDVNKAIEKKLRDQNNK